MALCFAGAFLPLIPACHLGLNGDSSSLPGSLLHYEMSYSEGSLSAGNQPSLIHSYSLEDSPAISVTFVPLKEYPETVLEPLESYIQRITIIPTDSAVTAVPGLLRKTRIGVVQDPNSILEPAAIQKPNLRLPRKELRGILPEGIITSFHILDKPAAEGGATYKLEINVQRMLNRKTEGGDLSPSDVGLNITLVATGELKTIAHPVDDSDAHVEKKQEPSKSAPIDMLTTETILLTRQNLKDKDKLVFLLPSPFVTEGIEVFAAIVEVKVPPQRGTSDGDTYATLMKNFQDDLLAAAGRNGKLGQHDSQREGIEDAIRLVLWPTHRRQAMLYLAREARAPFIEDITLSAPEAVMDRFAQAIRDECEVGPCFQTDSRKWRLQQIAYLLCVELMSTDSAWPELESILIRYAGQVGRHPSVLKEMVSEATTLADLEQRLLFENTLYLEDISPSARTRAYEWLQARGRAPAGYDPLGSVQERRSAINRFLQEQQQNP